MGFKGICLSRSVSSDFAFNLRGGDEAAQIEAVSVLAKLDQRGDA